MGRQQGRRHPSGAETRSAMTSRSARGGIVWPQAECGRPTRRSRRRSDASRTGPDRCRPEFEGPDSPRPGYPGSNRIGCRSSGATPGTACGSSPGRSEAARRRSHPRRAVRPARRRAGRGPAHAAHRVSVGCGSRRRDLGAGGGGDRAPRHRPILPHPGHRRVPPRKRREGAVLAEKRIRTRWPNCRK